MYMFLVGTAAGKIHVIMTYHKQRYTEVITHYKMLIIHTCYSSRSLQRLQHLKQIHSYSNNVNANNDIQ